MTRIDTDICVVGGGPAGLTLALLLLRSGVRVVVMERSHSLDREYRGEILQPGGIGVQDGLGVLAGARERGCHELSRFQLVEGGRAVLDIDYRTLPGPYNYLLSIPQRHVLEELLAHCRRHVGFDYLDGARVTRLLINGSRVTGAGTGDGREVRAHCTIGADGRYSKVRQLAGIRSVRSEAFDLDVLWFKVPDTNGPRPEVRIFRAGGRPVLAYSSYPHSLQLGWTLPHGGYPQVAERGMAYLRDEVARAAPAYADLVYTHVNSLRDLTLLDVFAGCAEEWVRDGLVLIGDSAHTHSPLGAQGINLATQDAAVLHPILLDSLAAHDASATLLSRYVERRRPDIDLVMKLQLIQSKGMLSDGRVAGWLRPRLAAVVGRTPLGRNITRRIAFGRRPIAVRADLFREAQCS